MSVSPEARGPVSLPVLLCVAVLPTLLLLLLLEGVCRAFRSDPPPQPTKFEMPAWMLKDANAVVRRLDNERSQRDLTWLSNFVEGNGFRVRLKPNLATSFTNAFTLIKNDPRGSYRVSSNSLGFRGPEPSEAPTPDVFRIAVFGDSSSFGWGVHQEEMWSTHLERDLTHRSGRKVEVLNFAIPGDSTAYGRLLFEKYLPKYPADVVIFGFGANDAKRVYTPHTVQVERFRSTIGLQSLLSILRHSAVFRTAQEILSAKPARNVRRIRVAAVPERQFKENLATMIRQSKELGAKQALVLSLCTPGSYAKRAKGVAAKNSALYLNGAAMLVRQIPEIARGRVHPELLKEMTDTYPKALAQNRLLYVTSDGCHPNPLGNRIVADHLVEKLVPVVTQSKAAS